ncbi:MAG TPA: hypothetical protein DCK93_12925 [Blastocatellia bacterium]|nr:hypothetical protein [Blastocatellia bacterium]
MTRWKRLSLVLLVLVLLTQIPFAYRRYKLGRLQAAIQHVNSQRVTTPDESQFAEYKGVVHVHSFLGGHSTGSFEEIVAGAKSNQLNFVVMTEHTSDNFNTASMTLKGVHAGILFINGNEVSLPDTGRLLLLPGLGAAGEASNSQPLEEIVKRGRGQDGLTFVAYPQEFRGWETTYYDGVEVYNVYTNARQINPFLMFFDGLWSYRRYPELLFANFYQRPNENLKKWDEVMAATGRKLVAVAGNDAHANVGFKIDSESGQPLIGLKLDPYERSFRLVRVHVLIPKDKVLDSQSLLTAIAAGHCFIGFDLFGDTSGFSFSAAKGADNRIQGDEILLDKEVRLTVSLPVAGRLVLLKDGKIMLDENGIRKKDYPVTEKGIYRVEVYLPQLPKPARDQPWIISNPIYVR